MTTEARTKTDILLNADNFPFITLTESKMDNHWYHEKTDRLFILTADGFMMRRYGSKKRLEKRGLL